MSFINDLLSRGGVNQTVAPPLTTSIKSTAVSTQTKSDIKGINANGRRSTATPKTKYTVEPVQAQPNNNENLSLPENTTFDIDGFRYGVRGDSNPELANPRSLDANGSADNDLASISLIIRPESPVRPDEELISSYSRFFLQSVTEAEQEKYQVVETFTGFYAFFYGKRPPIYRYSGLLLCDNNYRWNNDFKFVYENFFRGTMAVEFNAEVFLMYDGRQVAGFPLNLTMQQDAISEKGIPFSMDVLVVNHSTFSFSQDISSLLQQRADELAAIREEVRWYTERMNKDLPGTTRAAADQVLNGIQSPVSVDLQPLSNPISQKFGVYA